MSSSCGRYVIALNGEIYNHLALRAELDYGSAGSWRGTSDTETLLAAISKWGLKLALQRAYGMFAFALWDRQERELYLARDRMGEKPLYLARLGDGWVFGSELKALLAVPAFEARLNRDAVLSYLAYGYVPEKQCIFEDVEKVPAGHIMRLAAGEDHGETTDFGSFLALLEGALDQRRHSETHVDELEARLEEAVKEQMLSDVPIGCFLSGGVDSSLVAALMQRNSVRPVRTYAIGFREARFNEAPHAAAVAKQLKTEHEEFIVSEQDALELVPDLPTIYDEPFADASQIPTVLLCRLASREVTVALTGDGGDEVFGGYNRHVIGPQLASKLQYLPRSLRKWAGLTISACARTITAEDGMSRKLAMNMRLPVTVLDKAASLAPFLDGIDDLPTLYRYFTQANPNPTELMRDGVQLPLTVPALPLRGAEWMMAMDSIAYLPGDILVKVDRAAMAASIETRAPFLDARVVSAAWGLPLHTKIDNGKGKQILRTMLARYVPSDLIERPKQGFAIPLDRWLRGDLRDWAEELLLDERLFDLAGLKRETVLYLWERHQTGAVSTGAKLWIILMLLQWLKQYCDRIVGGPVATNQLVHE